MRENLGIMYVNRVRLYEKKQKVSLKLAFFYVYKRYKISIKNKINMKNNFKFLM